MVRRAPHARAPVPALRFSKMHGAGNDFVILDLRDDPPLARQLESDEGAAALCRALADRHVGVGCDQILGIAAPRSVGAVASYRIWNADGSQSQQCGNGARCVAAWLLRAGSAGGNRFDLDSPAGTHAVHVLGDDMFRITMGVPEFAPRAIPLAGFAQAQEAYPLAVVLRQAQDERCLDVCVGAVSMGNPHALIEVDDIGAAKVSVLGPALQRNPAFPESVNIGFAQIVSRDRIRLRVYERGAGETLACGSGACAAAVILMRRGRVDRDITVSLPGGELRIGWPRDDAQVTMAGPARFVFEGEWLS